MPLSPSDFYYYSQATGAPVADTPEKRAQQAPEVLAFRQQQLQAPKEGGGLLDALGRTALVAGLAAGGYGIGRYLRNRGTQQPVQRVNVQDLGANAEEVVRRAAAYQGPSPSRVATTAPASPTGATASPTPPTQVANAGIRVVDLSRMSADPWHADSAAHAIANEASLTQNRPQNLLPPAKPRIDPYDALKNYNLSRGSVAPAETLVDQQHNVLPAVIDHSINAVTSAEDQVSGRMKHLLQQNPHLDMSQIELMEEMAEHSHTQGMEQDEPMEHVAEQALGHPVETQEELTGPQIARQALTERRQQLAEQGIQGLRAEKQLAQHLMPGAPYVEGAEGYQQRKEKQGLALALQTGDPNILKVFQTGTLPETVKVPWGGTQLGEVSTSEFIGPTTLPEAVVGAQERHQETVGNLKAKLAEITNEVQPQINQLENQQYQEYVHAQERIPQIDEQLMMIEHHLSRGRTSGSGELLGYRGALTAERNKLSQFTGDHLQGQIDQLNHRLSRANEVYGGLIEGSTVNVPQTLKAWGTEGLKVAPEQIATQQAGYIDPATGEFRPSKQVETGPSVPILSQGGVTLGTVSNPRELERKGGGGRNVGEFVAGLRTPEVVRALKGGGKIRDYDPETGAVAQHYQPDETQSKVVTVGTRFDPQSGTYVKEQQTLAGLNRALDIYGVRSSTAAQDDPTLRPSKVPGASPTRLTQPVTPTGRQAIDLSRTIQGIYASGRPTAHQEVQALVESLRKQQNLQ